MKEREKQLRMSLVDWEGHEHPVALNLPGEESKQAAADVFQMLLFPPDYDSSWQGNKAVVSTSRARCEIDSDKLVGTWHLTAAEASPRPALPPRVREQTGVRQHVDFPNGTHTLQVWERAKWVGNERQDHLSRLEFVDVREKKTSILRQNNGTPILFPSPDGKHVAAFWRDSEYNDPIKADGLLWLIDQEGKVAAKLQVQRPTTHIDLSGVQPDGPWQQQPGPLRRCLRFFIR